MHKIGIITFPISKANINPINNLIVALKPQNNSIYLVSDGFIANSNVNYIEIGYNKDFWLNRWRVLKMLYLEFKITKKLLEIQKNVDILIFFYGGEIQIVPIFFGRFLNKKIVISFTGSTVFTHLYKKDPLAVYLNIIAKITLNMAHHIVVYSNNVIKELNLEEYRQKITFCHEHSVDFTKFKIIKPIQDRKLIGYVGRFSEEKGVLNLILAIKNIIIYYKYIKLIIIGDGDLREKINHLIIENSLEGWISVYNWCEHEKLPEVLNEIKLLIIPSFTEGLPNIMLEAMACGTPVLCNNVGSIPDIINDGQNGFLMNNNSPETIARNVIRALNYSPIESVVRSAYEYVNAEFSIEGSELCYESVINSI
jgi:glycosyltransferase involved in cell wall biosynthesis